MKKLLITCAALASLGAYAQDNIAVVTTNGYMPLRVDNRVSFYATKEYTSDEKFPKGSSGMFIITADCSKMLYKKSVVSIFIPSTGEHYSPNKTEDELAHSMIEQKFGPIDKEMIPIVSKLCKTVK